MKLGAAMQRARENDDSRYPCPVPEYVQAKNVQRVAKWAGMKWEEARDMLTNKPATFFRLLGWTDAEAEAEPIAHEYAEFKAKRKQDSRRPLKPTHAMPGGDSP